MTSAAAILVLSLLAAEPDEVRKESLTARQFFAAFCEDKAEWEGIIRIDGKEGRAIYVLKSGKLGVLKSGRLIAEISKQGAIFGEMSSILNRPRSATIKALTPCIIEVHTNGLDALLKDNPNMVKIVMKTLAERLAMTTDKLHFYMFAQSDEKGSNSKALVTSFRNMTKVDDQIIQRAISTAGHKNLVAALLDTVPEVREKFFRNMSRRMADIIREDMRIASTIHAQKKGQSAQKQIMEAVNELIAVRN